MIDPGVAQLMDPASELCQAKDTIRRKRRQILALASALRAEQAAKVNLVDLLDVLLAGGGD
jgi:hypothetical protein